MKIKDLKVIADSIIVKIPKEQTTNTLLCEVIQVEKAIEDKITKKDKALIRAWEGQVIDSEDKDEYRIMRVTADENNEVIAIV